MNEKIDYEELVNHVLESKENIRYIYNYYCVKCSVVNYAMIKIGDVVFCQNCHREEFGEKDKNPAKNQRKKYLKWLKVYSKKDLQK